MVVFRKTVYVSDLVSNDDSMLTRHFVVRIEIVISVNHVRSFSSSMKSEKLSKAMAEISTAS